MLSVTMAWFCFHLEIKCQVHMKLQFPKLLKAVQIFRNEHNLDSTQELWQLDKSQHSLGTCEAGFRLQKRVISLASGRRDKWLSTHGTYHFKAKAGLQALSASQVPVTYFRVHASILSPPSSSHASLPQDTHSPHKPAVQSHYAFSIFYHLPFSPCQKISLTVSSLQDMLSLLSLSLLWTLPDISACSLISTIKPSTSEQSWQQYIH